MKSLEELLDDWHDGELSKEDAEALIALLETQDARAQLVRQSFDEAVLAETFRSNRIVSENLGLPSEDTPSMRSMAKPSSTKRRAIVGLAMAACFVIITGWIGRALWKPPALRAELVAFGEGVSVERAKSTIAIVDGHSFDLRSGDVVRTSAECMARIQYENEPTWVELSSRAELELLASKEGKRIILRDGRFEANVAPQPVGKPMICETPKGMATVLGTRFFLTTKPDRAVLEVRKGIVQLGSANSRQGEATTNVRLGEQGEVTSDGRVNVHLLGADGRYEAESLLYSSADGDVYMRREQGKASGDYQRDFLPGKIGDAVTFTVPVTKPGTFRVVVGAAKSRNRAVYQLAVADSPKAVFRDQGAAHDYSMPKRTYLYEEFDLGTLSFETAGDKAFRFTCLRPGATGHPQKKLGIDYLHLERLPPR